MESIEIDFLSLLVYTLLENAIQKGATFKNQKIITVDNDAGNVSIYTEDEEECSIYSGFEYTLYSYKNKYLNEAIEKIKKIQWK